MAPHPSATTARSLAPRSPQPPTRGFALVEVVVSLVLLSCGALALVGATRMAIRSTSAAERQSAATSAAQNRLELLAAAACAAVGEQGGSDSSQQWMRERWTLEASRNGTWVVADSVDYVDQTGHHTLVLERLVIC